MIQDLSRSWCIKGTVESMTRVDSSVPIYMMHHDPERSWITDPDPDQSKRTHPHSLLISLLCVTASKPHRQKGLLTSPPPPPRIFMPFSPQGCLLCHAQWTKRRSDYSYILGTGRREMLGMRLGLVPRRIAVIIFSSSLIPAENRLSS